MSGTPRGETIKFEGPGKYRIVVQGTLNESWAERLASMRIICGGAEDGGPQQATLTGYLRDQAQLSGVLNHLYELHLPILLVEYIPENNTVPEDQRVSET